VRSSIITIGCDFFNDRAMSSTPAAPVRANAAALSKPGTCTIAAEPGLNPSAWSYGATLTRCPLVLIGIAPCGRCSRSPVGLERSGRVYRSFGNGSRHARDPTGGQSAAGAPALAEATAPEPAGAAPAGAIDPANTSIASAVHSAQNRFTTIKAATRYLNTLDSRG